MEAVKPLPILNCDQVYHVWSTEPHLLRLLDLRRPIEFTKNHIPGAKNISRTQLAEELLLLGGRLAVLISPPEIINDLYRCCSPLAEIAFLTDCNRWELLKHPLAGESLSHIHMNLKFSGEPMPNSILFHQLFEAETSTYTYIIADPVSQEAAILDPVLETVDRDLSLVKELGLRLMYVLETHIHADHITGAGEIQKRLGSQIGVSHRAAMSCADIQLEDGQTLTLGDKKIQVLETPGHTNTCLSYYFEGRVFTGDTLLIRGTGRTDFQDGSPEILYQSVTQKLFQLPEETLIYPGHDYRGFTSSTIALEKKYNPRLGAGRSQADFIKIMSELNLAAPKKIDQAVQANLRCGLV